MTVNGCWLGTLSAAALAAIPALLACVVLVFATSPARAADRCGIPAEVDALIETVSKVSNHDGQLPQSDLTMLRRELDHAERVLIAAGSGDLGLGGWKASFDWLFAASNSALETGRFAAPDQVRSQVGALIVALRFSCSRASATGRKIAGHSDQEAGLRGVARRLLGKKADHLFDMGYSPDLLLLVLGMVLSTTALIWAACRIADWLDRVISEKQRRSAPAPEGTDAPTQIYNQYDCRIHATLEIGLDVVDGSIVALDSIGARFQPVNEGAFERIKAIDDPQDANLVVGPNYIAFLVLSLSQGVVSGIFKSPITTPLMETLLNASVVPTEFTPPPRLKSPAE